MNVKEQRNMRCDLNFLHFQGHSQILLFFILKLTKANFFSPSQGKKYSYVCLCTLKRNLKKCLIGKSLRVELCVLTNLAIIVKTIK